MNWDIVKGNWKQLMGKAKEEWGDLTDDDWEMLSGEKDQLVGRLQERYGWAKEDAESKVDDWARRHSNAA